MQTKPTLSVSFEHRIRDEWVCVEASAWHDQDGIYRTEIDGVFLDGVNVTGLLTSYDLAEIDAAIEPALIAESADNRVTGDIPGPYCAR